MKISNPEVKKTILECILLKESVTKDGEPIKRTEFKREHILSVNHILNKVLADNIVTYIDEEGNDQALTRSDFLKMDHDTRKKFKIISEETSSSEIELNDNEIKTIKYFLDQKTHWPLISEESFNVLEKIRKGETND